MKKKLLVIFFLAVIPVYLTYKFVYKNNYLYLAIGDELAKGHTPFETYSDSYVDYYYNYLKEKNSNIIINRDYVDEDLRIKDLLDEITKSASYNSDLPQLIKDADVITISIGSEELFSKLRSSNNIKLNYIKNIEYIDSMFGDLKLLLKEIRKLTKSPVYVIGYYNPLIKNSENEKYIDDLFEYLDIKFDSLAEETKITYVKIDEGFDNNSKFLPNLNNSFPSLEGYSYIANEIIKKES